MRTVDTGKTGEDRAVCFLENNGYVIVARNVRSRMGEIDIVARERGVICFIEVRSRKGAGKSEESFASVDGHKQRKLSRLALAYLKANHLLDRRARFDVVAVSLGGPGEACALVKDAFPLAERVA